MYRQRRRSNERERDGTELFCIERKDLKEHFALMKERTNERTACAAVKRREIEREREKDQENRQKKRVIMRKKCQERE